MRILNAKILFFYFLVRKTVDFILPTAISKLSIQRTLWKTLLKINIFPLKGLYFPFNNFFGLDKAFQGKNYVSISKSKFFSTEQFTFTYFYLK